MQRSIAEPQPNPALPMLGVARPLLPSALHILPYLSRIDESRRYSNFGPLVTELEARLAARLNGGAVCTVTNATQGLTLLLQTLAPQGGLCVMPGFTFVATAHAAVQAGCTPYFADVDPKSWMLTPQGARQAITQAKAPVAAVIVVAAFGAMPDIDGFFRLRQETGVPVILDAAAAFDPLTTSALPGVVSLHATKVLGAGEGGYVVCADTDFAERVRTRSSFGFCGSRTAQVTGTNAKMSEYGAAIGLAALDDWPVARMRWMLAARKLRLIVERNATIGFQPGWGESWVSSTCVVATPIGEGPALRERLAKAGVEARDWWGQGLHREPAFADCPRLPLPHVEMLVQSTLGLPFAIDLTDDEIRRIGRELSD